MATTKKIKTIHTELSRIQKELKAPKNIRGPGGRYSYRNLDGILEALKPMLDECYITLNDEVYMTPDSSRFYVRSTATLSLGKESISVSALAREDESSRNMGTSQLTGSSSSYARKTALGGLLALDDSVMEATREVDSIDHSHPVGIGAPPADKEKTGKTKAEVLEEYMGILGKKRCSEIRQTCTTDGELDTNKMFLLLEAAAKEAKQ